MKLEFLSKSVDYVGGEPYQTRVVLGNSDGAVYPFFFDADYINKDNGELFKLAMERNYQENFPNRAENEKFNELGGRIAKYDELIEKAQSAIQGNEKATNTALETISKMEEQLALSDASRTGFTSLVMLLYGKGTLTDEDLIETGLFEI